MNILNQTIKTFSFEDIVAFCKEGHPEGIQLDYKKEFPKNGLAKHFASFSNAHGGVIIVGVEEDNKTSIPKAWPGIKNEGKLEERIHQFASNVEPIIAYELHITNEKNGKVFLIIRVFEGDMTPYYVQNDANLWIRTGNITRLIDRASPDEVELLFGKRNKAKKARELNIKETKMVFNASLKHAKKEKVRLISEEKEKLEREQKKENDQTSATTLKYKSQFCKDEIGTNVSMFTVLLQPFYPRKAFIRPNELKDSLNQIKVRAPWIGDFPSLNMDRIPEGLLNFGCDYKTGAIDCEQIYSNGLLYYSVDVLRPDDNGILSVWIASIASRLYTTLIFAANFYPFIGYQGGLIGLLTLSGVEGVQTYRITPQSRYRPWNEKKICLLPDYKWELKIDTSLLDDKKALQSYFIEKIKEIYWSLGYGADNDDLYEEYLKENGWLTK